MPDDEGLILDVTPGGETFETDMLQRFGHPVLVCHGPGAEPCPILAGHCPKVDHAHGVVFQLDLERPTHRMILQRYQEDLSEDTPIRVVVKPGQDEAYADLLAGVRVWDHAPSVADLDGFAAEVEAADRLRE